MSTDFSIGDFYEIVESSTADFFTVTYTSKSNPSKIITYNVSKLIDNSVEIKNALRMILSQEKGSALIEESSSGISDYYIYAPSHPSNPDPGAQGTFADVGQGAIYWKNEDVGKPFISSHGIVAGLLREQILAHEFSHLVLGTYDPAKIHGESFLTSPSARSSYYANPNAVVLGTAIEFENAILNELYGDDAQLRTHYVNFFSEDVTIFNQFGVSNYLKDGDAIQRTKYGFFTSPNNDELVTVSSDGDNPLTPENQQDDQSSWSDLLLGLTGNDVLVSGKGRDFLFGGDNDDKLYGGTGRDVLVGGRDDDQLWGGTKINVLTQLVLDGSSDTTTEFFDDEEQDLLEGGTGSDTYYVHAAEHTLDAETADPLAYFDFIGGWDLDYEVRNGFKFDDTIARFEKVDRIKDVDGNGDIRMQDKLESQFLINEAGQTFDRISYQGVDFFADEEQYVAAFLKDGDLHVMTSYRQAEYGDQIDAHWSGYVATVIIENFSNGDFNFNLPGADEGTNGNDTPALTPPAPGEGAYYHGLDGDDIIVGTAFDDALRGDAGNDQISGGDGNDDVSGGDGNDTVSGEDGNDFVSGGAGDDILSGGSGDDWIRGGAGRDTVSGGSGNDTLYGWNDRDTLNGGDGNDSLFGGDFGDTLNGGKGNDNLEGNVGWDTLFGNGGDDILDGGSGNDTLDGGWGNDNLKGGSGDDALYGSNDQDTLIGGNGNDLLDGGDFGDVLYGGDGNDTLKGGFGWDTLFGNADDDTLHGGDGEDALDGGSGNDTIYGGSGSDTFIFHSYSGADTIGDFTDGADIIEVRSGANNFGDVTITDSGDDALIEFGTVSITLLNVDHALIGSDDFQFV